MATKKLTVNGETVDFAIQKGLKDIGLLQDSCCIQILQRESQSIFGYQEAIVAIIYDEEESETALAKTRAQEFRSKFRFKFQQAQALIKVPAVFYEEDAYLASQEEREEYLKTYLSEHEVFDVDDEIIKDIAKDFKHQYDFTAVWDMPIDRLNDDGGCMYIRISENKMRCQAILFHEGKITTDAVYEVLKKHRIIKGILPGNVRRVIENNYTGFFDIARGTAAIDDKPGVIDKYFQEDEHKEFAKMMEALTIDTRTVKDINIADRHQLLIQIGNVKRGQDGFDIHGSIISKKELSEENIGIKIGSNVYFSDNKKEIYAKNSGHIKWNKEEGFIDVEPVYIVDGNVDFSEGNIIGFVGKVIIKGDIRPKFTVIAEGDVEVQGVVEEATVKSTNGSVFVAGSVINHQEGLIQAKETAHLNIATNAKVKAHTIIIERECMNSVLEADEAVLVEGNPGVIIGGEIHAKKVVRANVIGSERWVPTKIHVGDVSDLKNRLRSLHQRTSRYTNQLKEARQVAKILRHRLDGPGLTDNQQKQLEKAESDLPTLEDKIAFGQEEEAIIKKRINECRGAKLEILKVLHPQCDVFIFEAHFIPRTAEKYTGFHCRSAKVHRFSI